MPGNSAAQSRSCLDTLGPREGITSRLGASGYRDPNQDHLSENFTHAAQAAVCASSAVELLGIRMLSPAQADPEIRRTYSPPVLKSGPASSLPAHGCPQELAPTEPGPPDQLLGRRSVDPQMPRPGMARRRHAFKLTLLITLEFNPYVGHQQDTSCCPRLPRFTLRTSCNPKSLEELQSPEW